jgi:LysR family nitrogen assimilation transcriptional regulator
MDIDILKLFLSVAATGSFSRAAVLSNSSQSTTSKRILGLELALGKRLFERTGRGARLTEAGRLLVRRAESLVRDADGLASALKADLSQPQGTVRLVAQASVAWPLVLQLYRRLGHEFPLIKLQVSEAPTRQIVEMIQDGRVDLGVLSEWGQENLPQAEPLFSVQMFLVLPKGDPLGSRRQMPFAKLAGLPLLSSPMPNGARVLLEETAKHLGIELNIVMDVHSIHLTKKLTREGVGYFIGSRHSITEELASGALVAVPIVSPTLALQFYLCATSLQRNAGAVAAVAGLIRQLAR